MNKIINDYGQEVPAVGAPGSKERLKVQYPKLIRFIGENMGDTLGLHLDEICTLLLFSGISNYLCAVFIIDLIQEEFWSSIHYTENQWSIIKNGLSELIKIHYIEYSYIPERL